MIKEKNGDLIGGPIVVALLAFVIPLMLGSLIQQFYITVDAVVVGRFTGKEGLAAIDSVHTLFKFPINFMNGLAAGATILISRYFGASDRRALRACVLSAGVLAVALGAACSIAGVLLCPWLMRVMSVPEDILREALSYSRIYFGGLWTLIVYNMAAGVLRAFGDSKSPLYVLLLCTCVNVAGDLLLVGVLKTGVAGAAAATILSQFISSVVAVYLVARRIPTGETRTENAELSSHLAAMVKIGMPLALQSVLFPIANSIAQMAVNSMGTDQIAAWGICDKLDMLIWLVADSMSPALTTFTAQNIGAKQFKRARRGCIVGVQTSVAAVALISVALFFGVGFLARFFIPASDAAAIVPLAVKYMRTMSFFFVFYAVAEALSGACCGMGDTVRPMILTLLSICLLRVLGIWFVLPRFETMECIVWIYIASWVAAGVSFSALFFVDAFSKRANE